MQPEEKLVDSGGVVVQFEHLSDRELLLLTVQNVEALTAQMKQINGTVQGHDVKILRAEGAIAVLAVLLSGGIVTGILSLLGLI